MPEPLDVDYLKPFIDSTVDAAARFRRVLIVMITASVLAFGAYWNSRDKGWFNSRIVAARKGEAYLALREEQSKLAQAEFELDEISAKRPPDAAGEKALNKEECQKSELMEGLLKGVDKILHDRFNKSGYVADSEHLGKELDGDDYKNVRDWIHERMMHDRDQAAQYAQKLEEARTGNILLVRIPFFGLVFDVNDLGLWGGSTFVIILIIFRFTLWREYNNLRLTFEEARPEHLDFCYKSLAMQQVLTVPPILLKSQPSQKPWGKVVRALYLPPLFVELAILRHDYSTKAIGDISNPSNTTISIIGTIILSAVIALLTYKCFRLSVAIDRVWDSAAAKVREAKWGL